MSANPPGVDELDPEELERQFAAAGTEEPVAEPAPKQHPGDVPPAEPTGHHQTHSVPVDVDGTSVTRN